MKLPGSIVSIQWLATHLNHPNLLVLESRLNSPVKKLTATEANNKALQIQGARIFSLDDISDPSPTLPHMMPNEQLFTKKVRELGVCNNTIIVVYDTAGIYLSPRPSGS